MLKTYDDYLKEIGEIGHIQSIVQSIVYVSGLPNVKTRELVIAAEGQKGIVQALSRNLVEVLMLDTKDLRNGLSLVRTNETVKVPVSDKVLGRVVNPFIQPLDGAGPIEGEKQFLDIWQYAGMFADLFFQAVCLDS